MKECSNSGCSAVPHSPNPPNRIANSEYRIFDRVMCGLIQFIEHISSFYSFRVCESRLEGVVVVWLTRS